MKRSYRALFATLAFIMVTLFSSEGRCACAPYYNFAIMKDDNGKLGIMDASGNWIDKGWNSLKYNGSIANWLEAVRVDKYQSKYPGHVDTVKLEGTMQICYDDQKDKVVWQWIRYYRSENNWEPDGGRRDPGGKW